MWLKEGKYDYIYIVGIKFEEKKYSAINGGQNILSQFHIKLIYAN